MIVYIPTWLYPFKFKKRVMGIMLVSPLHLGKIEHTLFCYGREFELTFMGHISGSTALRVVPVLFPPVLSMGCWDEVNFKPYKRCHKLHVMANSSLSFLRLRSSAADYSRSSDVAWRIAWVTPNKWGGRSAPIYLHRRRGERVKIRHVLSLL